MGVPYLAAWLRRKYPHMICSSLPSCVHGLYIDLNGLIHPCCHDEHNTAVGRRSENEKLRQICFAIEMLVKSALPQYILYIAIDGVAPQAKMNQQRARRYMKDAWPTTSTSIDSSTGYQQVNNYHNDNNNNINANDGKVNDNSLETVGNEGGEVSSTLQGTSKYGNYYKGGTYITGGLNDVQTTSRSESGVDLSAIANEFTADETHAAEEELTEVYTHLISDPLYGNNTSALTNTSITANTSANNNNSNNNNANEKYEKVVDNIHEEISGKDGVKKSYRELGVAWLDSEDSENAFGGIPAESDFEEKRAEAKREFEKKQRYAFPYEAPYKPPREEFSLYGGGKENNNNNNYNNNNYVSNSEHFDSNCISPGTTFMERVSEAVQQFICAKLESAQSHWKQLHVIFSDSNTPGEGEHKIIDFIRTQASHSHFNNHGCHVIAGLDADLIFLALSLHLPQVYLLRDEGRAAQFGPLLPELEEEYEELEEKEEEEELSSHEQEQEQEEELLLEEDPEQQSSLEVYKKQKKRKSSYFNSDNEIEASKTKWYSDLDSEESLTADHSNGKHRNATSSKHTKRTKKHIHESVAEITIDANDSYEYFNIDVIAESLISEIYRLSLVKNAIELTHFHEHVKQELIATNGYNYLHPPSLQRSHTVTTKTTTTTTTTSNTTTIGDVNNRTHVNVEPIPCKTIALAHPCCLPSNSKVIDDVIVLAMIMGNDFIPHVPSALCRDQAMENILEVYVQHVLPHGYLTEAHANINTLQLERFFRAYAQIETAKFRHDAVVAQKITAQQAAVPVGDVLDEWLFRTPYYTSTSIRVNEIPLACAAYLDGIAFVWHYYCKIAKRSHKNNNADNLYVIIDKNKSSSSSSNSGSSVALSNTSNKANMAHVQAAAATHKGQIVTQEGKEVYGEQIEWAKDYAIDWSWYYPYHHAPFALDLADYLSTLLEPTNSNNNNNNNNMWKISNATYSSTNVNFRKRISSSTENKFVPPSSFAQLLCILPPSSASLLPECLQAFMTSKNYAPIADTMRESKNSDVCQELCAKLEEEEEQEKQQEEEEKENEEMEWKENTFPRRWVVDYTAAYQKEYLAAVMLPFADMPKLQNKVEQLLNYENSNNNSSNNSSSNSIADNGSECAQLTEDEKKRARNVSYHTVYFYSEKAHRVDEVNSNESNNNPSNKTSEEYIDNVNDDEKNNAAKQQKKKTSKNRTKEYNVKLVGMVPFDTNATEIEHVIECNTNTEEACPGKKENEKLQASEPATTTTMTTITTASSSSSSSSASHSNTSSEVATSHVCKMKLYDVVPIIRRPRIYATTIAIPNLTELPDGTWVKREREEMWFRRRGRRAKSKNNRSNDQQHKNKNKNAVIVDDESSAIQCASNACKTENSVVKNKMTDKHFTPMPHFAEFMCATTAVVLLTFILFNIATPMTCVQFALQLMSITAATLILSFLLGLAQDTSLNSFSATGTTSHSHNSYANNMLNWSRNLRALWASGSKSVVKESGNKHKNKSPQSVLLRNTSNLAFVDWQCPLCMSLNFSSNIRCFICDAPFDEHLCSALMSSKLPAIPPLFVGDHSKYYITYELLERTIINKTDSNELDEDKTNQTDDRLDNNENNNDNNNNSNSNHDVYNSEDEVSYFGDEEVENGIDNINKLVTEETKE